jgi:hypothetical protein
MPLPAHCPHLAARKHETVRRAVLRVMEAAAWPDLLAQTLDIQQLLLLTAACQALGSGSRGPYMQMVGQETSRVLADTPLRFLASGLGRVANLRLPSFKMDMVLLKFWVGRLAQAAQQQPEDVLAVVVALSQLGFRPGAGAAGLVLQPLLDAAAAGAEAAGPRSAQGSDDDDVASSSSSSRGWPAPTRLSPGSVLALTRVLADMGLNPDAASTQQLLQAQEACMGRYSVAQLLQLGRDVLSLELLTTAVPPTPAAAARQAAGSSSRGREGLSSPTRPWLLPGAGAWLTDWLTELQQRDIAQMDAAQVGCCWGSQHVGSVRAEARCWGRKPAHQHKRTGFHFSQCVSWLGLCSGLCAANVDTWCEASTPLRTCIPCITTCLHQPNT